MKNHSSSLTGQLRSSSHTILSSVWDVLIHVYHHPKAEGLERVDGTGKFPGSRASTYSPSSTIWSLSPLYYSWNSSSLVVSLGKFYIRWMSLCLFNDITFVWSRLFWIMRFPVEFMALYLRLERNRYCWDALTLWNCERGLGAAPWVYPP